MPSQFTRKHYTDYEIAALTKDAPNTTRSEKAQLTGLKKRILVKSIKRWHRLPAPQKERFLRRLFRLEEGDRQLAKECEDARRNAQETLQTLPPFVAQKGVKWVDRLKDCKHSAANLEALIKRLQTPPALFDTIRESDVDALQRIRTHPPLPPRPDGALKYKEADLPKLKKDRFKKADLKKGRFRDLDEAPLPPGNWQSRPWEGGWHIDQGASSTAVLFLDIDAAGNVRDRMMRKQVYQSRREWADATKWVGDVQDADKRIPVEVACLQDLRAIPRPVKLENRVNAVRLRDHHIYDRIFRYTMYLEYCPYGDLADVIDMHGPRTGEKEGYKLIEGLTRQIPEPFLWRVFHSLAKLGVAMKLGRVEAATIPPKGWKEIIHRDLRLGNIFLDMATTDWFEVYPTPLLGDFGAAIRTHENDPLNPGIFQDQAEASGFVAPEQMAYVDYETFAPVDRFKLSAKTNVWSVGMTMYALVCLNERLHSPKWLGDGHLDGDNLDVHRDREGVYSVELLDLIQHCIAFNPADRPDFETLLYSIDDAINELHLDYGTMEGKKTNGQIWMRHEDKVFSKKDKYKLGFAPIH